MVSKSRALRASRKGDQRGARGVEGVEQDVSAGIEEGLGVAAHLVVEDAALAPGADLLDEVGDQHGLAGAGGAGDDGVAGLGAVGPRDAGDAVGPLVRRRQRPRKAEARREDAPPELFRRDQFAAAQAAPALEPCARVTESRERGGGNAGGDPETDQCGIEGIGEDARAQP